MEQNTENQVNTGEKQENKVVRDDKGRIVAGTPNPNGRPKGSNNFKTDWEKFVVKVARSNNMKPEEINEQLLAVGFKKAKEGDYNFYKDIHDRVYGRSTQPIEADINGQFVLNWNEQKTYLNNETLDKTDTST